MADSGRSGGSERPETTSTSRKDAQKVSGHQPEESTTSDAAYESQVRRKIEEGIRDLDEGRCTAHEEVRERFLGR